MTLWKGAPVAAALTEKLIPRVEELKNKGITPCLAVVRVGQREDDLSYERGLTKRFAEAKEQYCLSETGRAKLMVLDRYLAEVFRVSFGNRIMRQIEEYVPIMLACGGSEDGALDDMLSRKILRKLEQLSPTFVRNEIPALLALLDEQFGPEALPLCREFLGRLIKQT
jgi:hypothetical protein